MKLMRIKTINGDEFEVVGVDYKNMSDTQFPWYEYVYVVKVGNARRNIPMSKVVEIIDNDWNKFRKVEL